ncbi:MAG TPA: fatty acid desaturase [Leptospiraceae bacterium]|nr:fatty acid desaturase [Leptospiraceae bacterium]
MKGKAALNETERVRKINRMIRYSDRKLKRKYPVLLNQDRIGMAIFLLSAGLMILTGFAYVQGIIPAFAAVIINAFLASLLHELEHDLIHSLYYKESWQEKLMMWGVWIFRGNTPSPFYRKKIHLLHHRESGQVTDIEEQMIGNGMQYGWKRFLVMFDQNLAFLLNAKQVAKTAPELKIKEMVKSAFPVSAAFTFLLHMIILFNSISYIQSVYYTDYALPGYFGTVLTVLNIAGTAYIFPNVLRQACLQFISSNMHYFGDVSRGREGVLEQTQVLNSWILFPFHLFCFNFGSTHAIHHFTVNQPFYVRQMISSYAHGAMKKYGVRFNDFGTFRRANRYRLQENI